MPRRNKHKTYLRPREPSIYDNGFKPDCYGCAFAGHEFKCMTSDGKCLKIKPDTRMDENAADK